MKRLFVLALSLAFLALSLGPAQAIEFRVKGDWQMGVNAVKNPTLERDDQVDQFEGISRLRTTFEFTASENLRGVVRLTTDDVRWGQEDGGQGDNLQLYYDHAYLDFYIPNTRANLKVGKQTFTLPNTLGSHIMDTETWGVLLNTPLTEQAGLTLGWVRPWHLYSGGIDTTGDGSADSRSKTEIDMFLGVLPLDMPGIQLNPFGMYVMEGKYSHTVDGDGTTDLDLSTDPPSFPDDNAHLYTSRDGYFVGLNATVDHFDPIEIMFDFNYGGIGEYYSLPEEGESKLGKTSGWISSLAVAYHMDSMTPMAFFLYESGESSSSASPDKTGRRMPIITFDGFNQIMFDLKFSSFGFGGSQLRGIGRHALSVDELTWLNGPSGKMAAGIKLQDISLVDKLTHDFLVAYYRGTNHRDLRDDPPRDFFYLTTKDSIWEVNLDTQYQVYKNLTAILELGYLDLRGIDKRDGERVTENYALKAAAGLRYMF